MDYSFLSSLGGGSSRPASYTLNGQQVRAATAVSSPTNTALGVQGGQMGGQGYGIPQGAVPTQNSMQSGSGVGTQLANSFAAIGDMISNYNMAGAYGNQEVAAQAPQTWITPSLANFTVPTVGGARI